MLVTTPPPRQRRGGGEHGGPRMEEHGPRGSRVGRRQSGGERREAGGRAGGELLISPLTRATTSAPDDGASRLLRCCCSSPRLREARWRSTASRTWCRPSQSIRGMHPVLRPADASWGFRPCIATTASSTTSAAGPRLGSGGSIPAAPIDLMSREAPVWITSAFEPGAGRASTSSTRCCRASARTWCARRKRDRGRRATTRCPFVIRSGSAWRSTTFPAGESLPRTSRSTPRRITR
jgi:hypothetical protein